MIDIPRMRAGPPIKVSATSYMAFLRCPAQAQARYDQKAFPKETVDSFRGALVHRLIARRLRSGPFEDVEHAARVEIGEALNEKMVALGVNRPSLLAPIIAEAADLFHRFCRFPIVGFEEAEITIGHELPDDVTLVGKIDGVFVDGQAKVLRDWKTGPLGEPFNQLLFYALVWLLARGEQARVEAFSLQTGEQARKEPSLADLQMVVERLADLVNQVRSVWDGEATPRKVAGPWCAHCPVLASCTEGQEASLMLVSGYRARQ
ncbi:MAG: RecB family exonuclease [Acidimicrobiia bacterium]